ncbi:hypothetical protein [Edaphovirga cremea]|uniref:hypothetical protein n=1 Tax=Edaphovirga cremea TaxID=2267246 RepID=UPI001300583A|nr:hypothetical protein [Edaphovirga cremea]
MNDIRASSITDRDEEHLKGKPPHQHLYRFRTVKALLTEFHELEKQEIFFPLP